LVLYWDFGGNNFWLVWHLDMGFGCVRVYEILKAKTLELFLEIWE
jgi:hypothetical protein